MNNNTKRRTAILHREVRAMVKGGGNFQAAKTELLAEHGKMVQDERNSGTSRGGTNSFRYKGI